VIYKGTMITFNDWMILKEKESRTQFAGEYPELYGTHAKVAPLGNTPVSSSAARAYSKGGQYNKDLKRVRKA
jgi:hypothetical protein